MDAFDAQLLERKKKHLLREIDNLDKARSQKSREYGAQILALQKQKKELTDLVARLIKQAELLEKTIDQEQNKVEQFSNEETKKVVQTVKGAHAQIRRQRSQLMDRELAVADQERKNKSDQIDLEKRLEKIEKEEQKIANQRDEVGQQLAALDTQKRKTSQALSQALEKTEDLTSKIVAQQDELQALTERKKHIDKQIHQDLSSVSKQKAEIDRQKAIIAADKIYIQKKENKLKDKEAWLEDRERTLARSFEELRKKTS